METHLVRELVLNWGEIECRRRCIEIKNLEGICKLEYLLAFNCKCQEQEIWFGVYAPSVIFENLLWISADSLKIFSIRGAEFSQSSTNEKMPALVNVEKLEIGTSLDCPGSFKNLLSFVESCVLGWGLSVSIIPRECKVRILNLMRANVKLFLIMATWGHWDWQGLIAKWICWWANVRNIFRIPNSTWLTVMMTDESVIQGIFQC